MQILGVGLGIILVVVGMVSVRVTGWFSGLYILFGITQAIIFWRRQGSFRLALFVDAIGIAFAGAWVAFGPQIAVTLNHRPYPAGPYSADIAGAAVSLSGAALAFLLWRSGALGHGELAS
jgi:crotonobetainyl-CoA:carnitine CoA-transferase CaiB-like acyl-CoA transferase